MAKPPEDRIQLSNPDPKKSMPRILKSTYALAHKTALAVLAMKVSGITLEEFLDEMKTGCRS